MGGHSLGAFGISVGGDVHLQGLTPSGIMFISRDKVGGTNSVTVLREGQMNTILVNRALVQDPSGGTTLRGLGNKTLMWEPGREVRRVDGETSRRRVMAGRRKTKSSEGNEVN